LRKYLQLKVERSKSRSGLHRRTSTYQVLDKDCNQLDFRVVEKVSTKPTYVEGISEIHKILLPDNAYVVYMDFILNLRKHIKGEVLIYGSDGRLLCRSVYRKLKVRVLDVDNPLLMNLIKCVFKSLKLPVKRYGVVRSGGKKEVS